MFTAPRWESGRFRNAIATMQRDRNIDGRFVSLHATPPVTAGQIVPNKGTRSTNKGSRINQQGHQDRKDTKIKLEK